MEQYHGTTIVSVRRGNQVALGGDGQVTLGNIVMKGGARKVRRIYEGKVLVGFAGGTADAFALQGASVHIERARRRGDIALVVCQHALDMLPFEPSDR